MGARKNSILAPALTVPTCERAGRRFHLVPHRAAIPSFQFKKSPALCTSFNRYIWSTSSEPVISFPSSRFGLYAHQPLSTAVLSCAGLHLDSPLSIRAVQAKLATSRLVSGTGLHGTVPDVLLTTRPQGASARPHADDA